MRLAAAALARHLLRHRGQLVLALLGVAVGVAVVVAVRVANAGALRALEAASEAVTGRVTHRIEGGARGVPEALLAALALEGVAAAPVVEGVVEADGRALRLVGLDPVAEAALRRHPAGRGLAFDGAALLAPGAVAATAATAEALGWRPGARRTVRAGGRALTLTLAARLEARDAVARQGAEGLLLADLATAQEALGLEGRLSGIDLVLDAGQAAALARWLPPGYRLAEAGETRRFLAELTRAFRLNLQALSLLALAVGGFLVHSTLRFAFVQRRALVGMLRASGAPAATVAGLLLAEAALLGLCGSLLGLGLGAVLGRGLMGLVLRTVDDLYLTVTVRGAAPGAGPYLAGLALGAAASLAAGAVPAWEAARTPVVAVLRRATLEAGARRRLRAAVVPGLVLAAAAVLVPAVGPGLGAAFAALAALLAALALLAPAGVLALTALLAPLAARGGVLAAMAVRGAGRALSRTGPAASALTLAAATAVGMGIMIDSFRATVADWLGQRLRADLYVSAAGPGGTLDRRVPAAARVDPAVAAVGLYRGVEVPSERGRLRLAAVALPPAARAGYRLLAQGAAPWAAFDAGAVLVSEPLARRLRLGPGDALPLLTAAGVRAFAVAGVYADYASDRGTVLMALPVYRRHWGDEAVTSVALFLRPGADPAAVAARLRAATGQALAVRSGRELLAASLAVFDRTFTVTRVLQLLAAVVAFGGMLGALMALQLERTREAAVLRAVGATPAGVAGLALGQAAVLGGACGVLAWPAGLALAAMLVDVVNPRAFGWSLAWRVDGRLAVGAVALALAAAVGAALWPAWRMARARPARALREE
ncbi:FtsX-like permease family protein [Inmirania thermothiophila]|uniref:Putative ABC transport system permease protein n=1 Tax=Inmirania thermothiophila TaxID=1750597 RepID=A0A3N1Y5Q6_9GAMM|nr:FtsX-like permease family protein [Inmirania thermothiophila]ROR34144.1 putative ABC transport system permease protein [Inmirania thermothiophila]